MDTCNLHRSVLVGSLPVVKPRYEGVTESGCFAIKHSKRIYQAWFVAGDLYMINDSRSPEAARDGTVIDILYQY